jgi:hypothetical protein
MIAYPPISSYLCADLLYSLLLVASTPDLHFDPPPLDIMQQLGVLGLCFSWAVQLSRHVLIHAECDFAAAVLFL